MKFEEALREVWVNGRSVRRSIWATVSDYTKTTPPLQVNRTWKVFAYDGRLINGWGGSVGGAPEGDPIRDGMLYTPSNEDKIAVDWELTDKAY